MWKPPTTLQAGKLGTHKDAARDGMFIGPSTALSMRGPYNPDDGRNEKSEYTEGDENLCHQYPRGATTLGTAAMKRTRG